MTRPLQEEHSQPTAPQEPGDALLLKGARDGDDRAAQRLFDRYQRTLVDAASRYLPSRDLAQDVAQEVFLKLLESPPSRLSGGTLRPWLLRVARNLSLDRVRRGKFEIPVGESGEYASAHQPADGAGVDPLSTAMRSSDAERIRHLRSQLPQELQRLLEARFEQGLSFQQIALREGIPLGTALWRLHHAFKRLRQKWSAENG